MKLPRVAIAALVFEGGMGGLAFLLAWLFGIDLAGAVRPEWTAVPIGLVSAGPLLLALGVLLAWPGPAAREFVDAVDRKIRPIFAGAGWKTLLLVAVLAGVGEELLFRGVVQAGLGRLLGNLPALFATAVLFGLVHWLSPGYALAATIGGLYFGWLMLFTGGLFIPMVGHAAYDFVALLILVRGPASEASPALPPPSEPAG